MVWTNITFLRIALSIIINILIFLDYILINYYIQVLIQLNLLININFKSVILLIIFNYIVFNILKRYSSSNHLFTYEDELFTSFYFLKCSIKSWFRYRLYYKGFYYNKGKFTRDKGSNIPFVGYIKSFIRDYITLFNIYLLFFNIFISLTSFPIKILTYICYITVLCYQFYNWIKGTTNKDILSLRDYDILSRYTLLNVGVIKDYFDNEGNLEWSELYNPTNFKKYLYIWIIMNIILKPYYIIFNHLIALVHIFSSKQFKIHGTWDYENEVVVYTYNIVKNPFQLKFRIVLLILYLINVFLLYPIRYIEDVNLRKDITTFEEKFINLPISFMSGIKLILCYSLQLGNLFEIHSGYFVGFKIRTAFSSDGSAPRTFIKCLTKDTNGYIYVLPLIKSNVFLNIFPPHLFEVFNFFYTILYGTRSY